MTVRFRPWALLVLVFLAFAGPAAAKGNGVRYADHWRSLGLTATDIELIDRLDLSRKEVERLVSLGVSVREYQRRPWESLGVTEKAWFERLEKGVDIASLERRYAREDGKEFGDRPNIVVGLLIPGMYQLREERYLQGTAMAAAAAGFLALTILDRDPRTDAIQAHWPILLGADMLWSGVDIWARHYRDQAVSGFSMRLDPSHRAVGIRLAASF